MRRFIAGACLVVVATACARPPLAAAPSPSVDSSPAAEVSPVTSPTSPPTSGPTIAPPTPSRAPVLTITSATFHPGEVGVAYSPVTLVATGGVGAYSWSISVGSLPAGLTVTTGGVVSGTPTAAGSPSFTVRVADTHGGSAIVNRSISVARHLSVSNLCPTTAPCGFEAGCTICGRFGTQGGGIGPFKYALTGLIPAGMTYSALTLIGTVPPPPPPTTNLPPPDRFSVVVSDSLGATVTLTSQVYTFTHISLPDDPAGAQRPGIPLTFSMPYSGGLGTPKAALVKNNLPKGSTWRIDTVKKVIVISVLAQPAGVPAISYAATFTLTDQAVCGPSAGQLCTATGTLTFSV